MYYDILLFSVFQFRVKYVFSPYILSPFKE
jgi:hypothetical protein